MILSEALRSVAGTLLRAGIEDAHTEARMLLSHVLGMTRTQLYTEPERRLTAKEEEHLESVVRRRLDHEPTAYIVGECGFYGIDLCIDRGVLIPRPETELLVEKALELAHGVAETGKQIVIADVGTGCGAIAVSLALALPRARFYATDISARALQVAERNCRRHSVDGRVELLLGDLLEPLPGRVDMIVANLPYVRDREFGDLSPEIVVYEPTVALAGGEDGLDRIGQMLEQAPGKLNEGARLLFEIGYGQGHAAATLVGSRFPRASVDLIRDPAGIDRVVKVFLPEPALN